MSRDRFVLLSNNLEKFVSFFFSSWIIPCACALSLENPDSKMVSSRRGLFQIAFTSALLGPQVAHGLATPKQTGQSQAVGLGSGSRVSLPVAYRSLSLNMPEFGVIVPVAMWHPTVDDADSVQKEIKYNHRISIKKIGQLLAGWDFIPDFAAKDFALKPTSVGSVVDGTKMQMPSRGPVVFLAHGYLGSRFDLSHLAEALAQEGTSTRYGDAILTPLSGSHVIVSFYLGFICVSAEFPESLASSYPRKDGLDRSVIMSSMLNSLSSDWSVSATSFGIVGHSLGCGTAINTGDDSWARVCIAGFPRNRDGSTIPGSVLFLTSINDGAVSLSRFGGRNAIPSEYVQLQESSLDQLSKIPSKAALLFDRPDAPNHISFLTSGVNDAMISLLSPLLPVAQAMNIPVLDFDKYKDSRDSKQTAEVVIPLVTSYLKQHMQF
jgi:hypothetical protein